MFTVERVDIIGRREHIKDVILFFGSIFSYLFMVFVVLFVILLPHVNHRVDMRKVDMVYDFAKDTTIISFYMATPMPLTALGAGKTLVYLAKKE